MSENGSENGSCPLTNYDSGDYLYVAGVRGATGLIAFICGLLLVIFFVSTKLKQEIVTNQFLVFCLAISVLLHSVSHLLGRVHFQTERRVKHSYCLFAGPLALYTGSTEWLSILCISCNLLAQVICQSPARKLKWVYCGLVFALPLLWCWLPFISQSYGTSGPWCGVRTFTDDIDCEPFLFGVLLRLILIGLPVVILLIITVLLSVATWTVQKHRLHSLETASYPQSPTIDRTQVLAELKMLLWFPPVYSVLQLPLLANIVYDSLCPSSPLLPLWYLEVLTSPLAGATTALLLTLHSETNTRARVCSWLALHCQCTKEHVRGRSSSDRHVTEYDCDLYISYGDSLEGVQDKHRRERIRKSHHISPTTTSS